MSVVSGVTSGDPASMLNAQLASALSTMGDAQFWEENISPSTIRNSLASSDPSNPHSTPALLKGMKWLLASISKGRDVSDFYPQVVKLVGAPSLEVRKMVYMFLVQYADHDATTRELSLLSINSFQRALGDSEQLIRALSLRVLTSIRIPDILQIQILGLQKCAKDSSPYVRKCAANALSKLSPRCTKDQQEILLETMKALLDQDSSTMVLTSAVVAFVELCPDRLELLHGPFRKLCHLVTDMDEWGQVIVIDTLARYCRKFFREPRAWKEGTAERIDRERRVRRTLSGIANEAANTTSLNDLEQGLDSILSSQGQVKKKETDRKAVVPKKVKRRVVKKGFYSDEEDESTEEEIYEGPVGESSTIAGVMRQRNIMGVPGSGFPASAVGLEADEDDDLHEDHRLLLRSSMPLLKSRNAGVVLAVCSLQYYCGVSSVKVRSSIGKALVRIHRDRREIQYVVLTSIRTLVHECPSAFAPFLRDFFVMAMDPLFTRMIKLDILTALALEPAAIEAVLTEFRTYVKHSDKTFACAAIQAIGTVVELARIVHDRHGAKTGDRAKERRDANRIALNCLHGLVTLTKASENSAVVGECVIVIQRILLLLGSGDSAFSVEDPNYVQDAALRRVLLLLVSTLNSRTKQNGEEKDEDGSDDHDDEHVHEHEQQSNSLGKVVSVDLPPKALAAALWVVGEWVASLEHGNGLSKSSLRIQNVDRHSSVKIRFEICRLIARSFVALEPCEKEQAIHVVTKMIISLKDGVAEASNSKEAAMCELVLSMGRVDVNHDVRDRARHESNLINFTVGLQYDLDGMEAVPPNIAKKPTINNLKRMFLLSKPASSSLPLEDVHYKQRAGMGESGGTFRFGTLSSLVGHRARAAYLPLPPWADKDSPTSLRDPQKNLATTAGASGALNGNKEETSRFYDENDGSDDSISSEDSDSSDSPSSSPSEKSSSASDDDSYDGDVNVKAGTDSSSNESSDDDDLLPTMPNQPYTSQPVQNLNRNRPEARRVLGNSSAHAANNLQVKVSTISSGNSSSSVASKNSDSDSSSDDDMPSSFGGIGNLIPISGTGTQPIASADNRRADGSRPTSAADDLKGLVLEPLVIDANEHGEPDIEKDSSAWLEFVRPQYSGGLSVKARYLRGKTKAREVQLLGMTAEKPTTLCLQVRFENQRNDGGVIRRIRVLQRAASSSSSHISPKRVVVPGEIASLKQGQMSNVMLGIDFVSASDRDDSLMARFDIKFNGGSAPVELRPNLAQMLQPCQRKPNEFDNGMAKLQGFNRVTISFDVSDSSFLTEEWVRKYASLTPVSGSDHHVSVEEGLRFVGSLPASGDPIYVKIACPATGTGSVTVCCEQALAVNGIANALKKAIMEYSMAR